MTVLAIAREYVDVMLERDVFVHLYLSMLAVFTFMAVTLSLSNAAALGKFDTAAFPTDMYGHLTSLFVIMPMLVYIGIPAIVLVYRRVVAE